MFFEPTEERQAIDKAQDLEGIVEAAWRSHQCPTSFIGLAKDAGEIIQRVSPDYVPAKTTSMADRGEKSLKRLVEEDRVVLIFDGPTPAREERSFVRGNINNRLWGVVLKLPTATMDRIFTLRSESGVGGMPFWRAEELPFGLLEALNPKPDVPEEVVEDVDDAPQEAAE